MRAKIVFFIFFLSAGPLHIANGFAAEIAGTITRLRGEAAATGERERPLGLNADVFVNDKITTGADARMEIRLHDGSAITLGQRTVFWVREFHHNEGDEKVYVALELVEGAFRASTSAIFKARLNNIFEVKTPFAVIGARGTDFWGGYDKGFLEVALFNGTGVYVENEHGRAEVTILGFGTDVKAGEAPTASKKWGAPRVTRALNTVSWD